MEHDFFTWLGFFLSFLATFLFSVFHLKLQSFSKISMSRYLEEKEKEKSYRTSILDICDDVKSVVEILRIFLLIAFLVYAFALFPRSRFWPLWLFLFCLGATIFLFDFLPRLITKANKNGIIGILLPVFPFFHRFFKPLVWLIKVRPTEKDQKELREASDEEIRAFIEEAKEEGIIEGGEGKLLRSVVEFGDTIVREIMTPRVDMVCIRRDSRISDIRNLVIKHKHSRIPVYRERIDNIEGVVLAKDLLEYSADKHKATPIDELVRPVHFVPESMKVASLLKDLQRQKQKLAIVVDEHGGVAGLVTMEDLVEEIVGEIQDEYDKEEKHIIKNAPHDYTTPGETEVEELEKLLDLELEDDRYITIGGLITHHLGRLPATGEKLEIKGMALEILDADQKKINKLRIKKL
ncbi:MAG: HlyC/CorC family transporter [Candidatus Aminicenantes bacterium]|nr:HlyC/CorC family transporter [Candidatus Aminicenantes bacterium]